MNAPKNAILDGSNPSAQGSSGTPPSSPTGRQWYIDEIVVAAFAFFGVGSAIYIPLRFGPDKVPAILISFLLATGLAALTYRYLGGIQGATFAVGALKLTGSLGALVGIGLLINGRLELQVHPPPPPPLFELWVVSGQVTNEAGKPIEPLEEKDVTLVPATLVRKGKGNFTMNIYSWPAPGGGRAFPTLAISHNKLDSHPVDLNPNASNDVEITRTGPYINIKRIPLYVPAKSYHPSHKVLKPVPFSAENSAPPSGSPQ